MAGADAGVRARGRQNGGLRKEWSQNRNRCAAGCGQNGYGQRPPPRPWTPRFMKSVLAAIDFSAGGKHVVAEAVTLARAIAARLVVLHVVQPPPVSDSDAGCSMWSSRPR